MTEPTPRADFRFRNVYIVEDDEAVRDSLRILLGLRGCRVHDFGDADSFLAAGRAVRPACLLLDVKLPGMSGLELQAQVKQNQPDLPVIIMTAHGDVGMARTALRAGALDFIEKPINDDELLAAIELALSDEVERIDKRREREEMLKRLSRLTPREMAVFQRATDGMHNREIAREFGISPRTVEVHRARLLDKLQADRASDLFRIRFALDQGRSEETQ
jgi:two-component system, LuxR family, response regulator FixJ